MVISRQQGISLCGVATEDAICYLAGNIWSKVKQGQDMVTIPGAHSLRHCPSGLPAAYFMHKGRQKKAQNANHLISNGITVHKGHY